MASPFPPCGRTRTVTQVLIPQVLAAGALSATLTLSLPSDVKQARTPTAGLLLMSLMSAVHVDAAAAPGDPQLQSAGAKAAAASRTKHLGSQGRRLRASAAAGGSSSGSFAALTASSLTQMADGTEYVPPSVLYTGEIGDAPSVSLPGGSDGCECVDVQAHWEIYAPGMLSMPPSPNGCTGWQDSLGKCLGDGYGSSECKPWDMPTDNNPGSTACMADATTVPPVWCEAQWCFVDAKKCNQKSSSAATYYFRGHKPNASANLQYSYITCGFIDNYGNADANVLALVNKTVRVTAPHPANPTPHFWREDENGTISATGTKWRGPVWDMVLYLSASYGFAIQRQELSPESIERNPYPGNSFWGCFHELMINATDLCVADFWAYPARRAYLAPYATFTTAFAYAPMYLFTSAAAEPPSIWQQAMAPVNAFTPDLWLVCLGCFILNWLGYMAAEQIAADQRNKRVLMKKELRKASHLLKSTAKVTVKTVYTSTIAHRSAGTLHKVGSKAATEMRAPPLLVSPPPSPPEQEPAPESNTAEDLEESMRNAPDPHAMAFWDAAMLTFTSVLPLDHEPRSHGGRVIKLGFTFFILLMITFWGSAVTTQFVIASITVNSGIVSLHEAQMRGVKICSQGTLGRKLELGKEIPAPSETWTASGVAPLIVTDDGRGDLPYSSAGSLAAMDEGYCDATVIELSQLEAQMSYTGETHCDKAAVGSSIITPPEIVLPVRVELEPIFSHGINQYRMMELYSSSLARSTAAFWPKSCTVFLSDRPATLEANSNDGDTMKIPSMLLGILATCGSVVVGLLLSFFSTSEGLVARLRLANRIARKTPDPDDADVAVLLARNEQNQRLVVKHLADMLAARRDRKMARTAMAGGDLEARKIAAASVIQRYARAMMAKNLMRISCTTEHLTSV